MTASPLADVAKVIEERFASTWTATAVAYADVPFQPATPTTEWVRVTVLESSTQQKDINVQPRVRIIGLVKVQIFTPANTGNRRARALADILVDQWQRQTVGGIRFGVADPRPVGLTQSWYQYNVNLPFYKDYISA